MAEVDQHHQMRNFHMQYWASSDTQQISDFSLFMSISQWHKSSSAWLLQKKFAAQEAWIVAVVLHGNCRSTKEYFFTHSVVIRSYHSRSAVPVCCRKNLQIACMFVKSWHYSLCSPHQKPSWQLYNSVYNCSDCRTKTHGIPHLIQN